jgi:uncharacterized protein (TIGR03435 family)
MPEPDDQRLLKEFAGANSEAAFAALVSRHVNLVYSTALRFAGNPEAAEEISQAVFIILARKAAGLRSGVVLSGWLYQTARLTAANYVKHDIRRQRREQEAYMQSTLNEPDALPWQDIAPLLDEAMGGLGETDRNAVVLRFFENKTAREVATALKTTEAAAHKRVQRALEKLRAFFARHGVVWTATMIAGAVSANSVHAAPAGLTQTISAVALAKGAAASASTLTLVKGALRIMIWNKVKYIALIGAGLLLASGTAIVTIETTRAAAEQSEANTLIDECKKLFDIGRRGTELMGSVSKVMESHQGVAFIRLNQTQPGEFFDGEVSGMTVEEGHVQIGAYLGEVLRYVYDLGPQFPQYRIIVPPDLIYARYDLVNTMGPGGLAILQRQLKEQFGIVAGHEKRKNLLLILHNPAVIKLHPHHDSETGAGYRIKNITMPKLAGYLSRALGVKVTDQTGLHGGFDYNIDAPESPTPDELKKIFSDQLGLDLVPSSDSEETDSLVAQEVAPQKHP